MAAPSRRRSDGSNTYTLTTDRPCQELDLDAGRLGDDPDRGTHPTRIAQDVEPADLSGVSGIPTFSSSTGNAIRRLRHRYPHRSDHR
jgi:hypothetical protein